MRNQALGTGLRGSGLGEDAAGDPGCRRGLKKRERLSSPSLEEKQSKSRPDCEDPRSLEERVGTELGVKTRAPER